MISTSNEPNEKSIAAHTPSEIASCMAAIFNVPNGNEPRKLTNMPTKKTRMRGGNFNPFSFNNNPEVFANWQCSETLSKNYPANHIFPAS